MRHAKPTLTIGIPTYCEEHTIKKLLEDILLQNQQYYILKKILVVADNPIDQTIEKVKQIKNQKITLMINKKRLGKPYCQNKIFEHSKSDIVVLLDADISLKKPSVLDNLVKPIVELGTDLTSGAVVADTPKNLMQSILKISMDMKNSIFSTYKNGTNIYTCHGRIRAFSKRLYKTLRFPITITAEDAYSYLYAITHDMNYQFVPKATITFQLPHTLEDHKRQSIRFLQTIDQLKEQFGHTIVQKEYHLPLSLILQTTITFFKKNPLLVSAYYLIQSYMKVLSVITDFKSTQWKPSLSSKRAL